MKHGAVAERLLSNLSIDTDPQQQEATSPQVVAARPSSRVGADVAGIALAGSGAAVVAFFGKFMLAVA